MIHSFIDSCHYSSKTDQDLTNSFYKVTRLLQDGSLEDVTSYLLIEDREPMELLFGHRRQNFFHIAAEVGSVEVMEHLITQFVRNVTKEVSAGELHQSKANSLLEVKDVEG